MILAFTIPGEPVAQGRGRAVRFGAGVRVIDPGKSRSWKGAAQVHMLEALERAGLTPGCFVGPVELRVVAVWRCPKGRERKTNPAPRTWKASRPDCDNVAKCLMDAANAILFADDAQVVRLIVEKHVASQGEEPRVEVQVRNVGLEVRSAE